MLATNYPNFKNKLDDYLEKITKDKETLVVTRNDNKNIVVMDLDEYNKLIENKANKD